MLDPVVLCVPQVQEMAEEYKDTPTDRIASSTRAGLVGDMNSSTRAGLDQEFDVLLLTLTVACSPPLGVGDMINRQSQ